MSGNNLQSSLLHAQFENSSKAHFDAFSHPLFSDRQISSHADVCVVVPVKNEETRILKSLQAFTTQVDDQGAPIDYRRFELLVLANNCTDHSVPIIKKFQLEHPAINLFLEEISLPPHQANIGYVRRLLMETAYKRLNQNGGGIIMTTDGDTRVAKDWISKTLIAMDEGAEAVGGRILLCPDELAGLDEFTSLYHFRDEKYRLLVAELESRILGNPYNPLPTHHQHFNGSFAVTTSCYARAGGIPDVNHLEDCAFFERLQQTDARIRHSNDVVVHTSARYVGRTEVGLSYQLNKWKNSTRDNTHFFVESPASIVDRLSIKKKLHSLWINKDSLKAGLSLEIKKISIDLIINDAVSNAFNQSLFFGEWYAMFIKLQENKWKKKYAPIPIDEAIIGLKDLRSTYAVPHFSHTSIR